MKGYMKVDSDQFAGFRIQDYIESVAKNCNIKYDLVFSGASFDFPLNTYHYQLFFDGEKENVELFKKAVSEIYA